VKSCKYVFVYEVLLTSDLHILISVIDVYWSVLLAYINQYYWCAL